MQQIPEIDLAVVPGQCGQNNQRGNRNEPTPAPPRYSAAVIRQQLFQVLLRQCRQPGAHIRRPTASTQLNSPRLSLASAGSAPLLLPHVVDVLYHLDGFLVVLMGNRDEFLVLAVGQPVERRLVLGRRLGESLVDAVL